MENQICYYTFCFSLNYESWADRREHSNEMWCLKGGGSIGKIRKERRGVRVRERLGRERGEWGSESGWWEEEATVTSHRPSIYIWVKAKCKKNVNKQTKNWLFNAPNSFLHFKLYLSPFSCGDLRLYLHYLFFFFLHWSVLIFEAS